MAAFGNFKSGFTNPPPSSRFVRSRAVNEFAWTAAVRCVSTCPGIACPHRPFPRSSLRWLRLTILLLLLPLRPVSSPLAACARDTHSLPQLRRRPRPEHRRCASLLFLWQRLRDHVGTGARGDRRLFVWRRAVLLLHHHRIVSRRTRARDGCARDGKGGRCLQLWRRRPVFCPLRACKVLALSSRQRRWSWRSADGFFGRLQLWRRRSRRRYAERTPCPCRAAPRPRPLEQHHGDGEILGRRQGRPCGAQ